MPGFGRGNPFPRRFGGGKRDVEVIHGALNERYSRVFSTDDDLLPSLEAHAEAKVLAAGAAAARRVGHQFVATKMLENLPVWEEATGLTPSPRDKASTRRAELAAKLRGMGPNTESDIRDACAALLGDSFVDVHYITDPDDEITYWPGYNPGPPGLEWATNKAKAFVQVRRGLVPDDQFGVMVGKLTRMLHGILPAWMDGDWFVDDGDDGFTLDVDLLDEDGL